MINRRRLLLSATALVAAAMSGGALGAHAEPAISAQVPDEVIAWLKANAIPLAAVEPGSPFHDLAALRPMLSKARVVSMGEATHGTREFFQLKHRLIEYCVSELGFTIIAFEANYGSMLAVNDYVLHGKGDIADVIAPGVGFKIYDTEEVLALIEWVRGWNVAHARKVQFHGLDMQASPEAVLHLLAYLERVAPALAAESERILAPLVSQFTFSALARHSAPVRERVSTQIKRLIEAFEAERVGWTARASETEWHLARQSAVVLEQFMRLIFAYASEDMTQVFEIRDGAMANNVAALLEAGGPDAKALVWAHNGHVKRSVNFELPEARLEAPTMGSFLHGMFGADHLVIGFAYNQGAFRVIVDPSGEMGSRVFGPAPAGYVDAAMASTGIPLCALDLTRVPAEGPVSRWMASKPRQRMLGNVLGASEHMQDFAADPRDNWDVIVFVEFTTAARGNPRSARKQAKATANAAPTNLELAGSNGIPDGWGEIGSYFPTADRYAFKVALADEPSPSGGTVVRIARSPSTLAWGDRALGQSFPAAPWRGRRLTFSAAMRADVPRIGTGAQILVEVWPEGDNAKSIVALQADGPVRSSQWKRRSVAIDVPTDAERIKISLVMTGDGEGFFGDLTLAAD
jgi:erythromycin esterase